MCQFLRWSRPPAGGAALLVVGSVVSVQVGQAVGKRMFVLLDPAGVVTLRLVLAALVLLALWRPAPPTDARSIGLVLAFGTAIAGMNLIYPALRHLPVGVGTSLQLLGPLTVAVAGSRRTRDTVWVLLAGVGVFLFFLHAGNAPGTLRGVVPALASGAAMGLYLLFSRRAGAAASTGSLLSFAVAWAAVVWLPFGVSTSGTDLLRPHVLAAGLGLAVLSAVVPYSLDLMALRRLPPRVVGVLETLEPVAGALAGLVLLGEYLTLTQWAAVTCITAAAAGTVTTSRPSGPPSHRRRAQESPARRRSRGR